MEFRAKTSRPARTAAILALIAMTGFGRAQTTAGPARPPREEGLRLLKLRDFAGAAQAFREAVRQNPKDFPSRYNLALSLANGGQRKEAAVVLKRLVRDRPGWGLAFYGLGHTYALDGESDEAEQAFRAALRLDPKLSHAHFELGKLLDEKGDSEGARRAYEAALRLEPDSSTIRYHLALLLRRSGDSRRASEEFGTVRKIREDRVRGEQAALCYKTGLRAAEAGDWPQAVTEFSKAMELRPDFIEIRPVLAEAHEQWGAALETRGSVADAIAHFREALKLEPTAETYNHVGVLLAKSGQLDPAIEDFRAALALDPQFQNAQVNLRRAERLKSQLPH